ncbi:DUF397 domain-containing protein [Streptomyces zingiberis]|uniref:DUF397 domain-containing protein n=1 Tax=Streptomyces zingiberis TaxID=2053010 RepID=A0ABX1C2W6_9ACTN|nr:DUF397 domain-containing protein [Streptomyces zingiberis]NJQ03131.1 DUF397 domain-containing protein [Streptomyces zingiberis]
MSVERASESMGVLGWFKSSHSGSGGGDCVEVATGGHAVYIRDSKVIAAGGPVLRVGRTEWAAFVALTAA